MNQKKKIWYYWKVNDNGIISSGSTISLTKKDFQKILKKNVKILKFQKKPFKK